MWDNFALKIYLPILKLKKKEFSDLLRIQTFQVERLTKRLFTKVQSKEGNLQDCHVLGQCQKGKVVIIPPSLKGQGDRAKSTAQCDKELQGKGCLMTW